MLKSSRPAGRSPSDSTSEADGRAPNRLKHVKALLEAPDSPRNRLASARPRTIRPQATEASLLHAALLPPTLGLFDSSSHSLALPAVASMTATDRSGTEPISRKKEAFSSSELAHLPLASFPTRSSGVGEAIRGLRTSRSTEASRRSTVGLVASPAPEDSVALLALGDLAEAACAAEPC